MINLQSAARQIMILSVALTGSLTFVGCQTVDEEAVVPAAIHARDDLQYYPPGPEDQLAEQVSAIKQYQQERDGLIQAGHADLTQTEQACPAGQCGQQSTACSQFTK